MSSISRMDVERRREEAQRMRANQAQLASKSQSDDIPEEPLFDEPRKIDQSDRSAQHIKKIFGEWHAFKWVSGMPMSKPEHLTGRQGTGSPAPTSQTVEPLSSLNQPRINGDHKHPPHFRPESRTPEVRQDAVSREYIASSSAGRGHPDNIRPKVDDRHRQTLQEHSSLSGHRQHPSSASASSGSTSSHALNIHGKPNHVRDPSNLIASHSGGAPHSVSPSKQHGSVVLSHSKQNVSPALSSSRDHHLDAPVHSVHLITAKVPPGSHVGSSDSDTHRHQLGAHPTMSKPGFSDHGRPDHRSSARQHLTPPPSHRTPPPPVQRTPPPPQRTPPPSHHHTPLPVSGDTGRSPSSFGQTKPKHLTLQIKQQQPVDFKDLHNIFEEMAVRPPHTAIQTPVKSSVNRFPFPSKSSRDEDVEVPKAEPQSETSIAVTEELLPTHEERNSVLDDLAVSDSEEEEEANRPAKAEPEEEPATVEKKPDSPMSSSNETSSGSESSSEDSSDSDSSSSDDEKDEEEEEKDTEEAETKKEEPEENSQVGWGLKNFMVARPSPPVAPLSSSQPSADSSLVKSLSPMEVKVSPRKMAEIGPCNSMPFMPHEDLDTILRNSEKASLSPDAPSTASSTASSHIKVKGQGWADSIAAPVKVREEPTLLDSIKQQESVNPLVHAASDTLNSIGGCVQKGVKSGPGRPKSVCSDKESVCGTATKRKGSVKDQEETSRVGSLEKKRKRRDSASSVKSKESKPLRVRTSSSSDDVDVESVTPDPRTNQSSVLTKDKVLEGLDSVSKQLFISPLSSPVHHPGPLTLLTETKPATPTKTKLHSRDHSSERGRRDSGSSTKSSYRRKSGGGGSSHIDSIMAEFKLPAMLSPTGPHHSPTPVDGDSRPEIVYGRSDFIPTAMCGGPSIVVRIVPSKIRNRPPPTSRNVCRTTGTKREALSPSVLNNSPSVTVVKGAVTASEDSVVPGACSKNTVDQKSSPLPSNSSPVRISSLKVKKENLMSEKPSKKQKSAASKSASKSTTETLQNGLSHSEVKKASKRGSERRSSTSSNRSSASKKLKKDSQSAKARPTEVPQQNGLDMALPFNSYSSAHSTPSHLSTPTPTPTPVPGANTTSTEAVNDPLMPADDRLEQPDVYLHRAKELKHIADKAEKPAKLVPYVKSILYFILWGYSQEKQQFHNEPSRVFPLYAETCQLLQFVSRFRNMSTGATSQEADLADRDKKLSVLILRMLALLNLKMFSLKKVEVMKFKKIIEHEYKNPSLKMSAHAPSPHQNSWNKNSTGTPSPMSPTPSPTCSIGSVGSQGSCEQSSKQLNGSASTLSSPAGSVPVPQRIHSVTQKYMASTAYLVQAHDMWDQSDAEGLSIKDFFSNLDNRCGPLSLHSNVLELVCYVSSALKEMGCS